MAKARAARQNTALRASIEGFASQSDGTVVSVSDTGLFVRTEEPPREFAWVRVRVATPTGTLTLRGRVVRVVRALSGRVPGVGIELDQPHPGLGDLTVRRPAATGGNRRRAERVHAPIAAQAAGSTWRSLAQLEDLSRTGACLVMDGAQAAGAVVGERVALRVDLPPDARIVELPGVVVWTRQDRRRLRVGLRFVALDAATLARIDACVERCRPRLALSA